EGRALRHVLDVRHESFRSPDYLPLARRYGCTTVHTDSDKFPAIADEQGDLAYIRLMRSAADCETGYPPEVLGQWAQGARSWIAGAASREVFVCAGGGRDAHPAAFLIPFAKRRCRAIKTIAAVGRGLHIVSPLAVKLCRAARVQS